MLNLVSRCFVLLEILGFSKFIEIFFGKGPKLKLWTLTIADYYINYKGQL